MKKKTIGISATKLILIIVAIIIVALLVPQFFKKSNKNSLVNNKNATENSTKEDEIIQSIRKAFDTAREEFVINNATIEGYQPIETHTKEDGVEVGTAFDLKNTVISSFGDVTVTDESKDEVSELSLDMFIKDEGQIVELSDGYHVYLSNGNEENEKFITIVYKDSIFSHGMAHYDTENNLVIDSTNGSYPILVAQIRLSDTDVAYYLEPVKSIK